MKYLFSLLRPNQWIKNILIFLPLIFGKKLFFYPAIIKSATAFVIFSMMSSVVYLINDIMDLEKDRSHPTKRFRPIASGKISVKRSIFTIFILGILSLIFSFVLNSYFGYLLVFYLVFNLIYSKILKDIVIIDIFCLSVFFILRLIAGSLVIEVVLSHWILIMTALLALFLGFNKRRQELVIFGEKALYHRQVLVKYDLYFIDQMVAVTTCSIVITYMLYTLDVITINRIGSNHLIYSIPFVYYGIFRYLYLIHKIKKEGDPISILLSDKTMQWNIILWISVCIAVIYFSF